jgi:NADH-quinone oxidoreductase subunit J
MAAIFFWLFSALMLGFACAVVFNRNPVASALSLVVSFGGLAALFFMLDAYFIGTIQILVYAGAVMVLFLFIIMLLDPQTSLRARFTAPNLVAGLLALLTLAAGAGWLARQSPATLVALPPAPGLSAAADHLGYGTAARAYGYGLFTRYLLPFEITGFLLLIAMVGIIVLSKREPRADPVVNPGAPPS